MMMKEDIAMKIKEKIINVMMLIKMKVIITIDILQQSETIEHSYNQTIK